MAGSDRQTTMRAGSQAQTSRGRERRFGIRDVVTSSRRTANRYWPRMLLLAVVIFGGTTFLETLARSVEHSGSHWAKPVLDLAVTVLSLLGVVFYTGMLAGLVGASEHGRTEHTTMQILRGLPYRKLIIADLSVTLAVAVGVLLLLVPGLVLFTLFALVGPIIEIERGPVFGSMRRSMRLVRRRFWLVAALVTVPVFFGSAALSAVVDVMGVSRTFAFALTTLCNDALEIVGSLFAAEIAFRSLEGPHTQQLLGEHRGG